MQDKRRHARVRVQVGSLSFTVPENDDTSEEQPNLINIVQQSSMIVNGFRANRPSGSRNDDQEWV